MLSEPDDTFAALYLTVNSRSRLIETVDKSMVDISADVLFIFSNSSTFRLICTCTLKVKLRILLNCQNFLFLSSYVSVAFFLICSCSVFLAITQHCQLCISVLWAEWYHSICVHMCVSLCLSV